MDASCQKQPLRVFLLLITLFSAILLGSGLSTFVFAQPVSSSLVQQKLQSACSFLKSLYNPSLQLVRTTLTSNIYYIASDNILAEKALSTCYPTISQAINQSISSCCNRGYDGMHEALLGAKISIPIHTSTISIVANSTQGKLFRNITPATAGGSYTILWNVNNATSIFADCTYADIAVYSALELKLEGNTTGVQHQMDCLSLMFDGRGLVDESYKDGLSSEHGIYQTYKLALFLYAQQNARAPYYGPENTLLRLQGPDGGFHTGYDPAGTYSGTLENAETTSIAIIAASSLPTTNPFGIPSLSIPLSIIYLFIGLAVAAVVVVIVVMMMEQKRRKRVFPNLSAPKGP